MPPTLKQSYAECRRVLGSSQSNFAWSFWLLPKEKRTAMHALYAFARVADELGDGAGDLSDEIRGQQLALWRAGMQQAWRCDWRRQFESGWKSLRELGDVPQAHLLPAIGDTLRRYHIPPDLLADIIRGIEMDLGHHRFATWEELREYCYHVAGAVGEACLYIWGFRGTRPFALARTCGEAFQMTNILRDLREDADRGRLYLPQEDLAACGCAEESLKHGQLDERFDRLMDLELSRVEGLYYEAGRIVPYLSPEGRRVFRLMFGRYRSLLLQIRRRPRAVMERRISLSLPRKMAIALREVTIPSV